jgi:hypothetical protein
MFLVEVERIGLWRKSHVERIKLSLIDNTDCEPGIYWDKLTELKSSSEK